MIRFQRAVPFLIRAVLLAGVACIAIGAGLISYRFYTRPVTLTLAVGAFDDKGKQIASIIAGRLAAIDSPIRLKIETSSNSLDAAKALVAGKTDLAIVRADAGDLTQARTIAVTAHDVVMIVAPPGSTITSIAKLRDHAVGVVGADINHKVVEALKKEYDLARANVTFKDVTAADAQRAVQSREVAALLLVAPLSGKTLSFVRSLFHDEPNSFPVLIPIESAAAIADKKGPYESFDIPKGTMRGAPAVPSDDVTTLRVADYLIANRHLNANLAADLTKKIMNVRRDLVAEQPALSGIASPDVDPDAYISVHPGAAAFYNGTQQSFMDRYGNAIYLTRRWRSARWPRSSPRHGASWACGRSKPGRRCWPRSAVCRSASDRPKAKPSSRNSRPKSTASCAPNWKRPWRETSAPGVLDPDRGRASAG